MNGVPQISERQEQILTALAAEGIAVDIDPTEEGGFSTKQLAEQFGVSEDEIGRDLKHLASVGFIEYVAAGDGPTRGDPVREANTDPDEWLHAYSSYEPIVAVPAYSMVFLSLMTYLDLTELNPDDLVPVLGDDNWLDFVAAHNALFECQPDGPSEFLATEVAKFLAAEVATQLMQRISARYPSDDGYSPVHIAMVVAYRAAQAAHGAVLERDNAASEADEIDANADGTRELS